MYTFTSRNREMDIRLVEIGVSILRADPKEKQTQGAREWAITVIEDFSGRKFSDEAKAELLNHPLDVGYGYGDYSTLPGYDFSPDAGSGSGGPAHSQPQPNAQPAK